MTFPSPALLRRHILPAVLLLLPLPLHAEVDFDCVMDAARIVQLSPRTPGVIDTVEVEKGQRVAKGDVIARIDSTMERAALKILEARVASTAVIDAQTARLAFAKAQFDRAVALQKQDAQSPAKVEELRNDLALATSQLAQAQVDRAALQAEADRARIAVENTLIRATVPGVVSEISLSPGEYATADRHVAVLAQTDPIDVDAYLPGTLFDRVRVGAKVLIRPEYPAGTEIEAQVKSVDAMFDPASRTFGLRVELPNAKNEIIAGQRCRLELATQ